MLSCPLGDRLVKYDLGGVGSRGDYITVNLNDDADILCDILNVDRYIKRDGRVDEIRLSHTLEHIPPQEYVDFILALRRKLKCGGRIVVIQTDAASVIRQWTEGKISFRAMRSTLFPPGDRLQRNFLNAHFQMWDVAELQKDFETWGFNVDFFDAGTWGLDTEDELVPEDLTPFQGVPIRNLGLIAIKPSIPRIIHQTWKTHQIPEELYPPEWVATWTRMEGFEYRLWTDEDNRQLIAERHAWFLPIYDGYDADIKRVDAARYFILYEFGGLYADLDFVCLRPLEPLLNANDLVLCYEFDEAVGNAFMAAAPQHFCKNAKRFSLISQWRLPSQRKNTKHGLLPLWYHCEESVRCQKISDAHPILNKFETPRGGSSSVEPTTLTAKPSINQLTWPCSTSMKIEPTHPHLQSFSATLNDW